MPLFNFTARDSVSRDEEFSDLRYRRVDFDGAVGNDRRQSHISESHDARHTTLWRILPSLLASFFFAARQSDFLFLSLRNVRLAKAAGA